MRFQSPEALWLLLLAPAALAAYLAILRRRCSFALRYPSVELVRAATPPAWRRHVAPAVFLVALVGALLACARPMATITLPAHYRTVVLAIDVSRSMRATDVMPNRFAAAKDAAKSFIESLPEDVRLGIVSFASTASLVQAPTRNKEDLLGAIDRLQLDLHTALGSGIIVALATLFPQDGLEVESYSSGPARKAPPRRSASVAPGSDTNAAIILLTDGRRTIGPAPVDAARMAAERGIRVYTVGFGNSQGGTTDMGDGMAMYMAFDEASLRAVAELTRAEYFHAATGAELMKIYEGLARKLALEREYTEVTFLLAAVAVLLFAAAAALSLSGSNRLF
ncbi:MAG TPA: VWA domain-containing protein [Burkholderiales bacterium]|nr:VWA domain-containing protein [Burkholderiales bacterium]